VRAAHASPSYLGEKNIAVADPRIADLGSQGKTVIFVLIGG
jgi:P-type E1-E2 ATPase